MIADDPFPIGDPGGMRAMAARLRAEADRVESRAGSVVARVGDLQFRGPKAERFRDAISGSSGHAARISSVLVSASETLLRAAVDVEAQQNAWHLRRARMLEEQA